MRRMLKATAPASRGSRIDQPVIVASMSPRITPTDVMTSERRCRPSPDSAGEFQARPRLISIQAQAPLRAVARPLTRRPADGLVQRARLEQRVPRLAEDQQRGDNDQRALEHGGKVFRLVVAERVIAVGRVRADPDRDQRGNRGHEVDDALERVREQRDAARHQVGNVLDAHDHERDADAAGGNDLVPVGKERNERFLSHKAPGWCRVASWGPVSAQRPMRKPAPWICGFSTPSAVARLPRKSRI